MTRAGKVSTLGIHPWEPIRDLDAVAEEGLRLLEFLAPAHKHEISVFDGPAES